MNAKGIVVCIGLACMLPCSAGSALSTFDTTEALFSPEVMASTNVHFRRGGPHEIFLKDYHKKKSDMTDREKIETFLLNSLTSIVVRVSTNDVNDGVEGWVLEDRGWYYRSLALSFKDFKTNDVNCIALASYIGRVQTVDFPTYWANSMYSTFDMLFSTNTAEVAEHNRRVAERNRALRKVRDLQSRVYQTNRAVREYRLNLCKICGIAVDGCSSVMAPEEFAAFTNRIVEVSGASQEEQAAMFDLLNRHRRGR